MFPALLKYWRGRRGLSQLEFALEAGVSPRHLSFLESGRAKPSASMVVRLFSVLRAPLQEQNSALRAAGFKPRFEEPEVAALSPEVSAAIDQMLAQHEPYPIMVLSLDTTILKTNRATPKLFEAFLAEPSRIPKPPDMVSMVFDPRLLRPFIVDWPSVAQAMLTRLHRERLERDDDRLTAALDRALAFPEVPKDWRSPDLARPASPALTLRLERGRLRAGFLITVTTFSAPQQVTLDELRIESCFPLDEATKKLCAQLGRPVSGRRLRATKPTPSSR